MASASGSEFILIVDDDPRLCRLLRRYLTSESYEVETVHDGQQMKRALEDQSFDLIILDLNLPYGEDGFSLASYLRATWDVPIIMLTGRSDCVDKVAGLELGADDYLPKPFEPRELLARLRDILRRGKGADRADIMRFGRLEIDTRAMEARIDGHPCALTAHQFKLLEIMAKAAGRVLSRDYLMDQLKGGNLEAFDRSIDVHISRIRAEVEADPKHPRRVITVRGAGYVFARAQD